MSHCTMLIMITMKGNRNRLTPAKDRMTVTKSVDKPMMRARVPIREKRSFHKLTNLSSPLQSKKTTYILYSFLCLDLGGSI